MMHLLTKAIFGSDPEAPMKRPSLMNKDELKKLAGRLRNVYRIEDRRNWTMEDWDALLAMEPREGPFDNDNPTLPGPFCTIWQYAQAAGQRAYERGEGITPPHPILCGEGSTQSFQQGFLDAMANDVRALRKQFSSES